MNSPKKVQVELVRSVSGTPEWMRVIVRTLGLRKIRAKVIHPDNGAIRGMVKKVPHLVELRELDLKE
jgi:large subunit ribosomal protein L30